MAWVLKNADIIAALPILADYYEKADGGSTTTLTCKRLTSLDDKELIGATIGFVNGDNAGTDAVITSYTSSSTATLGFATLSNAVDSSTGFGIVLIDYKAYIDRAYDIIANEMRNRGLDVTLFITTAQVKELHLTKALELICMAKRQDADSDDIYHESYLVFKENYESELTTIKADYDTDEDGTIDESEEKQSNQVVLMK
jgi:hypothetical protein